jgi:dihydroorotate dehydrogenase
MYPLLRSILFQLPAERAHAISMTGLRWACNLAPLRLLLRLIFRPTDAPIRLLGLSFRHRVGLAAGFDKNAKYLRELETIGFSHVEIGTVTPIAQSGNPLPRLFRLPKDRALINRMGFNNDGLDTIVQRLKSWRGKNPESQLIIGGNIGKNKQTPNDNAWTDYLRCFEALHPFVDYFTVNVSSPNTPGLRALQEPESLKKILTTLQEANKKFTAKKPILLKIAPDLENEALGEVVDLAISIDLDGLVIANTTLSRSGLNTNQAAIESIGLGGLSGAPLRQRSMEMVKQASTRLQGKMPIIASGGIFTRSDAQAALEAGASLVQVWTGFIYEGPTIVKKITKSN